MLTDELRSALRTATDQQPYEPDVSGVFTRVRQLRRRRTMTWTAVGVGCVGVVTAAGVLVTSGPSERLSPAPADGSSAALVREVDNWGPPRGSLANDSAFLNRVKQEWADPSGRYYGDPRQQGAGVLTKADGTRVVQQPDRSRHLTGDVRVLFAGQTPDGPAAVVAQPTTLEGADMYLGFLLPTGADAIHLVAAYTPKMFAQHEIGFGSQGLDTHMISFKTSAAGNHFVVLPADATDTVSVSLSHTLDASGQVQRHWSAVPTSDGVATVTAPGRFASWDALVRVDNGDVVLDESPVWDVLAGNEGIPTDVMPPKPANALDWPLSDQEIGGSIPGDGYRSNLNDPWIAKYAKLDEPTGGQWWVTGSAQDRHMIVVEQLWFYGDPAHTVVMRMLDQKAELLSDTVTDPTDRPLVFLRLPDSLGWLVVGGPDASITGWREQGATKWSAIDTSTAATTGGKPVTTDKSTFIRSTADHIQVRIDVNGKTQIASK